MMNLRFSLRNISNVIPDLFYELTLPDGVDRQLFIDTLIDEYGDMGIARPIEQMKTAINIWSRRHAYELNGLWQTTQQVYSPIENYNRNEDTVETTDGTSNNKGSMTATGSSKTDGTHSSQTSQEDKVSAYDATGYENQNQSAGNEQGNTHGESIDTSTTTNSTDNQYNDNVTRTSNIHGNIGVTTTQKMLAEERRIVDFDFYHTAANIFACDLLIGIYL